MNNTFRISFYKVYSDNVNYEYYVVLHTFTHHVYNTNTNEIEHLVFDTQFFFFFFFSLCILVSPI